MCYYQDDFFGQELPRFVLQGWRGFHLVYHQPLMIWACVLPRLHYTIPSRIIQTGIDSTAAPPNPASRVTAFFLSQLR
jgi:hypothetical protein